MKPNNRFILGRKTRTRAVRDKILIVCEGEKTEPNYFRAFPVNTDVVEVIIDGSGHNTDSLVEKAIELTEEARKAGKPYNQTWCVFDRDSFPAGNFNRAITIAENKKIKVAYSNEAFELWFLLHFEYCCSGIVRSKYIDKLEIHLGHRYQKNSITIYKELKDKQKDALRNAKTLIATYQPPNPESNNPSTTVYLLVQELNRFII